jgi:hypothetical protein
MVESEFGVKAAQLHALAAELAAAVSADTSGVLAVEVLPEVFGAGRQLDLLSCRLIERADRSGAYGVDGAASTAAFVRQLSGEHHGWVAKRVQVGRALADRMPVTAKAFEAGDLGLDHATVIQQATRDLDDAELALELEGFLAQQAGPLTPRQLRVVAEELLAAAAPDESAGEAARKHAAQHLNLSETLDGRWRLDGWLDAEAGMIVSKAIAAFTRKPDPDGDVLTESVGSRRAEALLQLARHATAHAESCHGEGGGRHTIIVGLSHQALLDGLGTAGTPDGQRLPAAAARRMACDAAIIPAVYGTDSEVLDFGRRTRTIATGLRHFLAARDGGCTWPGCDRPPSHTEAHHRKHWINGGETNPEHLDLLCPHHHHKIHEGGWTMTIGHDPDRTPCFHPPDGRPPLPGQRRPLLRPPGHTPAPLPP